MEIFVNGESRQIEDSCSVRQLLETMQLVEQRLAVEVNEAIVPKSRHEEFVFHEGDKVEIVHAIGGG